MVNITGICNSVSNIEIKCLKKLEKSFVFSMFSASPVLFMNKSLKEFVPLYDNLGLKLNLKTSNLTLSGLFILQYFLVLFLVFLWFFRAKKNILLVLKLYQSLLFLLLCLTNVSF